MEYEDYIKREYMGLHIRTWYGKDALNLLDTIRHGNNTPEDLIQNWSFGIGEADSTEEELVDTRDCDVWFLAKIYDDKFLILFSNIDSEPDAMCDIFSID